MKTILLALFLLFPALRLTHAQVHNVTVREVKTPTQEAMEILNAINAIDAQEAAQKESAARIRLIQLQEEKARMEIEAAKKKQIESSQPSTISDDEVTVPRNELFRLYVESLTLDSLITENPELKEKAEELKKEIWAEQAIKLGLQKATK